MQERRKEKNKEETKIFITKLSLAKVKQVTTTKKKEWA
jgi:hypothetical protein